MSLQFTFKKHTCLSLSLSVGLGSLPSHRDAPLNMTLNKHTCDCLLQHGFLQTWCFVKISASGGCTEPWSIKVISGDNFQLRKGRKGNLKMCLNFMFRNLFFSRRPSIFRVKDVLRIMNFQVSSRQLCRETSNLLRQVILSHCTVAQVSTWLCCHILSKPVWPGYITTLQPMVRS